MNSCRQVCFFFQFMANLQPSGSRIPDSWSKKVAFLLIVAFYLTEPANRTKVSKTAFRLLLLSKSTIFPKILIVSKKKADISKIKGIFVLKGITNFKILA